MKARRQYFGIIANIIIEMNRENLNKPDLLNTDDSV